MSEINLLVNLFIYSYLFSMFCIPTILYCNYRLEEDDRIFRIRERHQRVLTISRYTDYMPIEEAPVSVVVDMSNLQHYNSS